MLASNRIRHSLAKGLSIGAWLTLPGTHIARVLASQGFDWVLIDGEHGALADADWHAAVPIIASCGASPIIRIAGADHTLIKRALDTGAHGVMVPMVNTRAMAESVVAGTKFPPMGIRGFGSPFVNGPWGCTMDEHNRNANRETVVIVQIETKEAVENIDEIASVPGVDVLFVGPNDLAASYGRPPSSEDNDPAISDALEKIKDAAKRHNRFVGIWATDGPMAARRLQQGFQMVSVGAEILAISGYYSQHLAIATGTDDQALGKGPAMYK
ncbi:HpcH/HpaI aldolase/citrate lyase family protein [Cladochytrium replicatum]|nr:HpcH/HpaI aldolase/citrate lyase family protein [Cladochytrium replicatum]